MTSLTKPNSPLVNRINMYPDNVWDAWFMSLEQRIIDLEDKVQELEEKCAALEKKKK